MRIRWSATVIAPLLALVACGSDATPGATPTTPGATVQGTKAIAVTVQEFAVLPDAASAPAGKITFTVTNKGPDDKHEFVVFKTDLAPGAMPVKDDKSVDESGPGVVHVGEIEEFAPGTTESMTFDLAAGNYVLLCNLVEVDAGVTEVHYQLGMRTAFTVT